MATFYMNRRGGLTVDRDSLHASDGYKRQVEALDKLRERSMNAGLREAVEKLGKVLAFAGSENQADWQTIRQALRDQEAEIARLRAANISHASQNANLEGRAAKAEAGVIGRDRMLADCFRMAGADPDGNEDWRIAPEALRAVTDLRRDYDEVLDWQARCEKAEALLREAMRWDWNAEGQMPDEMDVLEQRITAHLGGENNG